MILDEIQHIPEMFQELRDLIDRERLRDNRSGRFLLLGFASIDQLRQSGESLAGRTAYVGMSPFNSVEVPEDASESLWIRGGFPDSFLATDY